MISSRSLRCALLSNAAIAAALLVSTPALAQAADEAATNGTDIIVTAQRRAERLQDVPIAITAASAQDLTNRNVTDLSSLRGFAPSLTISTSGGVNASNLVSIRGITGQPLPIGAGQATAIYIDGVYLSRPDAAFFGLDDVERIEVLSGPQGTLYGRNATAGAINIITRTPGQTANASFDLSYGSFGTVSAKGSVGLPIGGGFSVGLSGSYGSHNGYFTNTVTGGTIGDDKRLTLRAKLHYESPNGGFKATLSGDMSNVDGQDVFKSLYAGGVYVGIGDPKFATSDISSVNLSRLTTRSRGLGLVMDWEAATGLTLTSISSYRRIKAYDAFDLDGSAAPALMSAADNYSRTFSQELRAHYTAGAVDLTVGGNYYDERATWGGYVGAPTVVNTVNPFDTTHLKAAALFAQLEYKITDQLTVVGGLRYNHEDRDFTNDYRGLGGAIALSPLAFKGGNISDNAVIPSAGINFKAAQDVLVYAKVSKGYQAPGFNVAPGALAPANTFKAESLWAYEVGLKSQFFDRRVTFNVAGYIYDYSNIQVRSVPVPGTTAIDNAAAARVKGVEASLKVVPTEGLTLSSQATYSSAKYLNFCQPISAGDPLAGDTPCTNPAFANRSGNRLSQAPEWSGGLNLNYRTAVGNAGELNFNIGYTWESIAYLTAANEREISTGGWDRVDARLGFTIQNGPEIYLYGRNITNRRYFGYALRGSPTLAPGSLNEPRIYGIGVRKRF